MSSRSAVGVLAFNCAEWFYSAMGAIHAGGVIAGIYTTNSADAVLHVLENSHAEIVVVDDAKQMEKIHAIKDKLPNLKACIQIQEPYAPFMKKEDGYYRVRLKTIAVVGFCIFKHKIFFFFLSCFVFSGLKLKI